MVTVSEDKFFHLHGRHVQHAHGRNSASDGEHLSGAMIALMPTEADAKRLRLSGGEKTEDLHLTLYFLGEGADWPEDDRRTLINALIDLVYEVAPTQVTGNAFGVNHWNGNGDKPCWVLAVGDIGGEERAEKTLLGEVRRIATDVLEGSHRDTDIPEQFTPWVPHMCMAYTDDLSLAAELQKRLGEITFDRIRIAFAGEYTDIPLGENLSAAAYPLRRNLKEIELRSRTDFARMQQDWESAVDSIFGEVLSIRNAQREQITAQVLAAAESDDLNALNRITLSDEDLFTVLLKGMTEVAQAAGEEQQREAEEQGVSVPPWALTDENNLTAAIGRDLLQSIARITARIMNTSFIQSGVRRALSLIGRPAVSPEQVAAEVNTHLSELSDASPRESIGGAITAAQNEGRRIVLSVAPPASSYVSSEILDKSVCGPCRTVDGTEFESLADAEEQYPSGGYRDCQGGVRCRGTIVAVWDQEE